MASYHDAKDTRTKLRESTKALNRANSLKTLMLIRVDRIQILMDADRQKDAVEESLELAADVARGFYS